MHGKITGVQECAPEGDADWYKRRTTQHATPKEYPLPPWAAPRVRARRMAALETIRTALEHPPTLTAKPGAGMRPPQKSPRYPFGICRGRTKTPTNPHPPHVYTATPAHFIRNKPEVPAQRPGRCRTSTRVAASRRGKWCRSTPKQDTCTL